ncbi:MAG: dihydrolipoamide acetyltransferase family protein [Dehalococcoidia bacterium]|nr:dihydrolipoamide acetyltransferase family protein [Dehalococcoidia bacterium]
MAYEVVMPQMGAEMKEGKLIRWLKNEGDPVTRGEAIAEIETDKANVEIEAFEGGIFGRVLAQPGETVAVGQVIAIITAPGEEMGEAAPPAPEKERAAAAEEQPAPAPPEKAPPKEAEAPARAEEEFIRVSPVARRIAEEKGVDLRQVRGSGPEGRIVRRDVEAFLQRIAAPPEAAPPEAAPPAPPAAVPMSRMRQTIARRMSQSKREAPHYYVVVDVDMTEAQRMRSQLNASLGEEARVSVNDLLVKAAAKALAMHPMFNTWFVDGEVRRHEAQNVCIAIALEEGLIAPAILEAGRKNVVEIAAASRSLAERAKSGTLKAEEYSGGTFTVSNLGMFGVEELIAIIQPPQTAILGVGAIRQTPVVRDGAIVVAEMMKLALSGDHRVTDGAQGAEFLGEIKRLLEAPLHLLL